MSPIDYKIDVATPFESALKGYVGGAAIRDDQFKQQQQQVLLAQQQEQKTALRALVANPNPTAKDYADASLLIPGMRENFKQAWDMRSADQQQNLLSEFGQVHAALANGKPEYASAILNKRVEAMKNSGVPDDQIAPVRDMAKIIEANPAFARALSGMKLASIPGGDKLFTSMATQGAEQRAQDQAPADLAKKQAEAKEAGIKANVADATQVDQVAKASIDNKNVLSQIQERGARLSLDQDKLTSEVQIKMKEMDQKAGTLDDGARKIINESSAGAVVADQSATQMLTLADRLEQEGARSGVTAKGAELYKHLTGNQDGITALRQEYTRLRSSAVLKMLPPGPASDKDIAFAMKGFPDDTSDANTMASFLRGMGKIQQREAVGESAKAEWVNAVGSMGKPKTDIEIDGIKVPAGTTYVDFMRKSLDRRAEQRATEQKAKQVQGRSYMRFAQPQGAPALGTGLYQSGTQ